ncbi:hypothetical protein AXF42_Ash017118 [Apostasia shenzhenica]|uniref:Uncharacterized protein n=1 Tax=Apostasia shenzhenica TaxID=1088818 RepID=A0A2H9ZV71_9ASPA|nr:hypothetical protein AXF42_Ash017118 [Apostasia shenzhenica]
MAASRSRTTPVACGHAARSCLQRGSRRCRAATRGPLAAQRSVSCGHARPPEAARGDAVKARLPNLVERGRDRGFDRPKRKQLMAAVTATAILGGARFPAAGYMAPWSPSLLLLPCPRRSLPCAAFHFEGGRNIENGAVMAPDSNRRDCEISSPMMLKMGRTIVVDVWGELGYIVSDVWGERDKSPEATVAAKSAAVVKAYKISLSCRKERLQGIRRAWEGLASTLIRKSKITADDLSGVDPLPCLGADATYREERLDITDDLIQ